MATYQIEIDGDRPGTRYRISGRLSWADAERELAARLAWIAAGAEDRRPRIVLAT